MTNSFVVLTENMWMNMYFEGRSKGYSTNYDFIDYEGIGRYYPATVSGELAHGAIEFNTPELMTFYLLRWS